MTYEINQHEELLKTSEVLKETLNETCDDYFLLLNTRLKIITCNKSASKLFNQFKCNRGVSSAKGIAGFIEGSHLECLLKMFEQAKKGETSKREVLMKPDTEESYWVRFTVSPAYNNKNEIAGIGCVGRNVHKEKTQEEKIEIQKLVLRKIAQQYSHEVRHPLTNILAIINLIKYEDFKMTEAYLGYLESASKELDHVIRSVVLASDSASRNN